jgi:alkylation response protein AidB-like acyl-CoA dehydrogenase
MDLVLTEEQRMLMRAAKDFAQARSPVKRAREAARSGEGWSRELWREMARLGWLGLTIGQEHGGAALGHRYLAVVLEELGKNLVPEPIVSTVLLGGTALELGGSKAVRAEHLPAVVAGERTLALAYQEARSRFALGAVDTTADARDGGHVLRGEKVHVMDGTTADLFVVSARAPGGIALFLVPARAKGVTVTAQSRLDGRSAALVRFEDVALGADARLGSPEKGLELLERVIDTGAVGLSAEMLGSMGAALAMTLEYLKTRVQFGVPIGTFQALQHRASRLYVEAELARSAVMYASASLDEGGNVARAASLAKAKCSEAFLHVACEAVQMHGGIGMTEEHDVGLFLKRARVAEMTFGDAGYHRDRFARAEGF